ncbi:DUF3263 domain-containing protein [Nocardioides sp.]|uniref:DUF3263 domain-containing protein n=1 Tax=Nocardioides sp. TaxID=35761 RepID=UPI0035B046FF
MAELNDEERAILDFEGGGWWKHAGAKETAIRETFGVSATRYFQQLNGLIDRPEALPYAPLLVKRLQRQRAARARQRDARRLSV